MEYVTLLTSAPNIQRKHIKVICLVSQTVYLLEYMFWCPDLHVLDCLLMLVSRIAVDSHNHNRRLSDEWTALKRSYTFPPCRTGSVTWVAWVTHFRLSCVRTAWIPLTGETAEINCLVFKPVSVTGERRRYGCQFLLHAVSVSMSLCHLQKRSVSVLTFNVAQLSSVNIICNLERMRVNGLARDHLSCRNCVKSNQYCYNNSIAAKLGIYNFPSWDQ